jgi:GAF domain-containing protein
VARIRGGGFASPADARLAVPLTGQRGRNVGVIQLSDKYEGEFSAADEAVLVEFGRLASDAVDKARRAGRARRRGHR